MGISGETILLAGITQYGRPFAAYGSFGGAENRLQKNGCGVEAVDHYIMKARKDRTLFLGNGRHVDSLFNSSTDDPKNMYCCEELIIRAYLREHPASLPVSISMNGNPNSDVIYSAGVVKPEHDIVERCLFPEESFYTGDIPTRTFIMMANEPSFMQDCKGFSTEDLAFANNNGFCAHMPIRHYEINGNNPQEITDRLFDYMGHEAVSSCAAIFDPDTTWHMAVRNK